MLIKTKGVVLRKIPYSETSIISDIYTESEGRISCIISGVRKAGSRVSASLLEVMTIVDLVVYYSDKSRLNRIREIKAAHLYKSIPFDVRKNAILLFAAELLSKVLRESDANPAIFALIEDFLVALDDAREHFASMHLLFMIRFADELGFGPAPNYSAERPVFDLLAGEFIPSRPEHAHYIPDGADLYRLILAARGLEDVPELPRNARNRLVDDLVTYFQLHTESLKEMRSHHVLRDVL